MQKHLYVTTPIYYVNDAPHIGHAYTTVLGDVLTRFHAILGWQTFYLTGTDEHGQKVQRAAAKRGVDPQRHVDEYYHRFEDLWKRMGIRNDFFIRTTMPEHKEFVRECLQKLWDKGEIYSKEYEGWYSVGEERFFSEDELDENKCDPIGHRPVEWLKEKNYFFRMGKYQQRLIDHLEAHPDWIVPDFRRNEVLGFLKQPLNDLCISRPKSRLSWGIPLPFDEEYVTYVWFDALLNYVSASASFRKTYADGTPLWPATYHLIGKDILTTHSVYWPTMLMALELPLPEHILAHGWWLVGGGEKMSKSAGNVVNPMDYMERFGNDAFRYFLAREMVVGQDATFSHEAFVRRVNSDLANDLGNGLNRVAKLLGQYCGGEIPPMPAGGEGEEEQELRLQAEASLRRTMELIPQVRLSQALEEIFVLVRAVNRYLETRAPWKLAKDPARRDDLVRSLRTAAEAMRLALQLLQPVMPEKASAGLRMLGSADLGFEGLKWGVLEDGAKLAPAQALFPRIETEPEAEPAPAKAPAAAKPTTPEGILAALDLRVAKIVSAENHPDADALYVLKLDDGLGGRTVCAGLRSSYSADELKDRKVALFANLKPAKLRGVESRGMLLAADGEGGKAALLDPGAAAVGERLSWSGLEAAEPATLNVKDFAKIELKVSGGNVSCLGHRLESSAGAVLAAAPDGAAVH